MIVFQSNLNPILELARLVIRHKEFDPQPLIYYRLVMACVGFATQEVQYSDVIALALSGGFLMPQLVPSSEALYRFLLRVDDFMNRVAQRTKIQPLVCWRSLLIGCRWPEGTS